jgi:hypothetical protein
VYFAYRDKVVGVFVRFFRAQFLGYFFFVSRHITTVDLKTITLVNTVLLSIRIIE